jgi:hypothetical protein
MEPIQVKGRNQVARDRSGQKQRESGPRGRVRFAAGTKARATLKKKTALPLGKTQTHVGKALEHLVAEVVVFLAFGAQAIGIKNERASRL